jgi:hypothetical protein
LHTCWSIVFECLNSNSYLNSFDWVVFQIENLSLLSFSFVPNSGMLCFELISPKSGRAPSVPQPGSPSHLVLYGPLRLWPGAAQPRAPPVLRLTGGSRPSFPTSGRVRLGQGPQPEPVLRASLAPRPAHRGALSGLFKGRQRNAVPPFAPNPSAPEPPPPTLTLAAPPPLLRPSAAFPPSRSPPTEPRGGEEHLGAFCARPRVS